MGWILVAAGLAMGLTPWLVVKREFGGAGVLVTVWNWVNPQGLPIPEGLDFAWLGWCYGLIWVWLGLVWGSRCWLSPWRRWRWRLGLGLGGLLLAVGIGVVFWAQVGAVNQAALAAGVAVNRLPLRRSSLSLGWVILVLTSVGVMVWGRWQLGGGKALLVRYRQVLIPLVALALAVGVGAGMVWILRPGLGWQEGLDGWTWWILKWDLVTYTYQLLFQPLTQGAGWLQSLVLATPLIYTGLAVALGFHGGLFNIGAPGQLTLGAIAAMLVGVYCPGPGWLVLPLAIAAAALGGALWGAIPGWLKAHFGTHEVINTIMLNYIAASLFLFLLGANQYTFFGQTITLPFKAPGSEARSAEIQPTAQIPMLLPLLGIREGVWDPTLVLVVAGLGLGWLLSRQRKIPGLILGGILGGLVGWLLPPIPVTVPPAIATVRLNGSFILALLALLAVHVYLWHTQGGYELRAMGFSPPAAAYGGVNLNRQIVWVMALSGSLAGLAATHYV
ncbi:MAG: hypothetical protein Q6K99_11870, partial [Thermostichales cyanobacterium BF4_bins_65]